jgi:hypothetical protein
MKNSHSSTRYVHKGVLYFRSRRAARLNSALLGIDKTHLPERTSRPLVFCVTFGWWLASFLRKDQGVDLVVIPNQYGRFGNQVRQLTNAISAARRWSAREILAPYNETFLSPQTRQVNDLKVVCSAAGLEAPHRKNILSAVKSLVTRRVHVNGHFFHTDQFQPEIVSPKETTTSYAVLRQMKGDTSSVKLDSSHLVIHLRGEDTFIPTSNTDYGQPPLSFYEIILEREGWTKCTIVYMDEANPVFSPIISLCKKLGIPILLQSGTVEEDINFLMGAKSLVASRSTFITSITGLSHKIERIFSFGDQGFFDDLYRRDAEIVRIVDTKGEYWGAICSNNWKFTPDSVALMLNYPKENLSVIDSRVAIHLDQSPSPDTESVTIKSPSS